MASKIEAIGLNLVASNKFKTQASKQIRDLQTEAKTFMKTKDFEKEIEDQKSMMREYMMAQVKTINQDFQAHKEQTTQITLQLENQILKNQNDTIWQIKDCAEELKTRITEAKVLSQIETLDKKITIQIRN